MRDKDSRTPPKILREWAASQGIVVSPKGPVSIEIDRAYRVAQGLDPLPVRKCTADPTCPNESGKYATGWCPMHWQRWFSHGDVLWEPPPPLAPHERFWPNVDKDGPLLEPDLGVCWIWRGGKDKKGFGSFYTGLERGYMRAHHYALEESVGPKSEGDVTHWACDNHACVRPSHLSWGPREIIVRPLEDRFWEKVAVREQDDCWEWTAAPDAMGYGSLYVPREGRVGAHRVSWMLANGPIPEGLDVCHACDNPPCVNPGHLFVGTHKENMLDMVKKGRHPGKTGEDHPMVKLTEQEVLQIRYIYETTSYGHGKIAKMFNVHKSTVRNIVNRKTWRHI